MLICVYELVSREDIFLFVVVIFALKPWITYFVWVLLLFHWFCAGWKTENAWFRKKPRNCYHDLLIKLKMRCAQLHVQTRLKFIHLFWSCFESFNFLSFKHFFVVFVGLFSFCSFIVSIWSDVFSFEAVATHVMPPLSLWHIEKVNESNKAKTERNTLKKKKKKKQRIPNTQRTKFSSNMIALCVCSFHERNWMIR